MVVRKLITYIGNSMSGKKVNVKLKSGKTVQVFDYEVKELERKKLVAKEEKQTPQTKENKQAANRKTK